MTKIIQNDFIFKNSQIEKFEESGSSIDSRYVFTSSYNDFTSSFTSSVQTVGDGRYVLTGSNVVQNISSSLSITGSVQISSSLNTIGQVTFTGSLTITGSTIFSGTVGVNRVPVSVSFEVQNRMKIVSASFRALTKPFNIVGGSPQVRFGESDDGGGGILMSFTNADFIAAAGMDFLTGSWTAQTTAGSSFMRMINGAWEVHTAPAAAAIGNTLTTTQRLFLTNGGQFGVGRSPTTTASLEVQGGAAKTDGSTFWALISDRRLKENIVPITGAVNILNNLTGMNFDWKDKRGNRQAGFIAQDVQRVKPDWVQSDSEGFLWINPKGMDVLLVEAVKELAEENKKLVNRIIILEEIINKKNILNS